MISQGRPNWPKTTHDNKCICAKINIRSKILEEGDGGTYLSNKYVDLSGDFLRRNFFPDVRGNNYKK